MAKKKTPKRNPKKILLSRKTQEVKIQGLLVLDGRGRVKVNTGINFLDHMLDEFAFHGFFDLELKAQGDLGVDIHHTNEDIVIVLGDAFKKAIGDTKGLKRFGQATVPMEDALVQVVVDVCGRGNLSLPESPLMPPPQAEGYGFEDTKHFLDTFAKRSGTNIKIFVIQPGIDTHHFLEATFKALGLALDQATQIEPRRKGIPSTKGVIDL